MISSLVTPIISGCKQLLPSRTELPPREPHILINVIDEVFKKCVDIFHVDDDLLEKRLSNSTATEEQCERDVAQPHVINLLTNLRKLRSQLFLDLLMSSADRKRKEQFLVQLRKQISDAELQIEKLSTELSSSIAKKELEVHKIRDKMASINLKIEQLDAQMEANKKLLEEEGNQRNQAIITESQKNQEELKQKASDEEKRLTKLNEENEKAEKNSRKEVIILEAGLEELMRKYDTEMTALQEEYDEAIENQKREQQQLEELEEKFVPIEKEYLEIQDELYWQERTRQKQEAKRLALENAITTIQAFWRAYKTRKTRKGKRGGRKK